MRLSNGVEWCVRKKNRAGYELGVDCCGRSTPAIATIRVSGYSVLLGPLCVADYGRFSFVQCLVHQGVAEFCLVG